MNISYDLWPIWADYLEEQDQNTELLRYVMTYGVYSAALHYNMKFCVTNYGFWLISFYDIYGCIFALYDVDDFGNYDDRNGNGIFIYEDFNYEIIIRSFLKRKRFISDPEAIKGIK